MPLDNCNLECDFCNWGDEKQSQIADQNTGSQFNSMSKRCIALRGDWLEQLKLESIASILKSGLTFCLSSPGYRSYTVATPPKDQTKSHQLKSFHIITLKEKEACVKFHNL